MLLSLGALGSSCKPTLAYPCESDDDCLRQYYCETDDYLNYTCTRKCTDSSQCQDVEANGVCDLGRGYCYLFCFSNDECPAGTYCSEEYNCRGLHVTPTLCVDADGDGKDGFDAASCSAGQDHCDADRHNWTEQGCALCLDVDGDGYGTQCDAGGDCDDTDPTIWYCAETVWSAVSAGAYHTCAVGPDASLWCWGANAQGQLGVGSRTDQALPSAVSLPDDVVAVSAGAVAHSCAVLGTGTLWCWGANESGQLGTGSMVESLSPLEIAVPDTLWGVAAGGDHTCGVGVFGAAWCWGAGSTGALGNGLLTDANLPVAVVDATELALLATGPQVSCAVTGDGTSVCWGANEFGQLGVGDLEDRAVPTPQLELGDVRALSVHATHGCAVTGDGQVWCWGGNFWGQLGTGTTDSSSRPEPVQGLNSAVDVAVGQGHSCAVVADGTVWCWGRNVGGALGDGTLQSRLVPGPVFDLTDAVAVTAGERHTCALTATGALWCWGVNWYGQLGDGSTLDRMRPVPVNIP